MSKPRFQAKRWLFGGLSAAAVGLGILLLAGTFGSAGFTLTSGFGVSVSGGAIRVDWCINGAGPMEGWPLEDTWFLCLENPYRQWLPMRPRWDLELNYGRYLSLPLWYLFMLVAGPWAILLWRGRRRGDPGACRACGYDMSGLGVIPRALCPECGEEKGPSV